MHIQTVADGGRQVLHHQFRQLQACLHTHTQELDYVWVVELPKKLTLGGKPVRETYLLLLSHTLQNKKGTLA